MISDIGSRVVTTVQFAEDEEEFVPLLEEVESTDSYGKFRIAGLERGWGTTLGNSLRRVLLGAMPGVAITSARIVGQQHEYGSVPHMRESIGEFLINAKGIRIQASADTSQRVLSLSASGEGEVVAGDILPHDVFTVVNPEHHLATLDSEEAELVVRFDVEKGDGFRVFDHEEEASHGVLPVDAIFTPVLKASYEVERLSGRLSGKDLLTIELWTDRTVTPLEALTTAAKIIQNQMGIITDAESGDEEQPTSAEQAARETKLKDLSGRLSPRTINALTRHGIQTVGDAISFSPNSLQSEVRNFGEKSVAELREYVIENDLAEGDWPVDTVDVTESDETA